MAIAPHNKGYIITPSDDPAFLYQDIVVKLSGEGPINTRSAEGPINNGQPTLHATCLGNVDPANGETVLHIGAGTGLKGANTRCFLTPRGDIHAAIRRGDLDVSPPSVPCPPTFQWAADRSAAIDPSCGVAESRCNDR
jgi:hypothetical protein